MVFAADVVSILLAAAALVVSVAALVVSVAALWFTSLRRPQIEVDLARDGMLAPGGMESGGMPAGAHVSLYLFVANTGASGTVLTRFDATDFIEENTGNALWGGLRRTHGDATLSLPHAMERDDAVNVLFDPHLTWKNHPPIASAAEYARRLHTLRSVTVTLRWEWRRTSGLGSRRRESVQGEHTLTIDAEQFRRDSINAWRESGHTELAELAEGTTA